MKAKTIVKGKKGQQLNQREAKLINDASVNGLLLFDCESKNDRVILTYHTDGLISLDDFLRMGVMSKRLFVVLLRNIVVALKSVEENRFSKSLIVWSPKSSYVDPASWHVYLMYVPLQPYEAIGNLENFILETVSGCTFEPDEDTAYVRELVREVNNGVSYTVNMLETFCDIISEELIAMHANNAPRAACPFCKMCLKEDETTCPFCGAKIKRVPSKFQEPEPESFEGVGSARSPLCFDDTIKVTAINAKNRQSSISVNEDENGVITVFRKSPNSSQAVWLEDRNHVGKIPVTKFPFRIGKMEGATDYRVYSHTVSRKHADIIKEQGKYYIVDLGSTNGTYLNGKKIQTGVKEELLDGTYFKLADMEFKFHVD